MITRQFLGLGDLSGAQTLCVYKLTEVVVIGKQKNFMVKAFQGVFSDFKSFNNG